MICQAELGMIKNWSIKRAVTDCLEFFESKLKKTASSTSGKYHPLDERKEGGLILHMRRVVWYCVHISNEFRLTEFETDCLIAAALLHDIYRCKHDDKQYTSALHPIHSATIAVQALSEVAPPDLTVKYTQVIYRLIATHMSHWFPWCPQPNTTLEHLFAFADYLAAKPITHLDILAEQEEEEVETVDPTKN